MAFPCSLDGRHTVDYYEDSVTLGLAPRRRSRVPFSTERIEHDVGAPFISLNRFVINRLSGEGYGAQKSNAPVLTASPVDAVATRVRFHRWGLGVKQSSFRPIMRALQDDPISVFRSLPLFRHALVPSSFRLQVNRMAQRSPFEPLLTESRIQCRVPRRTVSLHSAQASQRPCEGPVSSQQPAGYTIRHKGRCPYGEGSTSGTRPPSFATPSISIPPWFSCRDTAGKSARLRVG